MLKKSWCVAVGGSRQARLRWPSRCYRSRSAAARRSKRIHAAHAMGVSTIWIYRDKEA